MHVLINETMNHKISALQTFQMVFNLHKQKQSRNLLLTVIEMGSSPSWERTCVKTAQRHTQIPSMSTERRSTVKDRACKIIFRLTSLHVLIPVITSLMALLNESQRLPLQERCLCWRRSSQICDFNKVKCYSSVFLQKD